MPGYPYQGIYPPFGYGPQNRLMDLPDCNPLPANAKSANTGDAGADGYTVLARASRIDGWRPDVGGTQEFLGPNLED